MYYSEKDHCHMTQKKKVLIDGIGPVISWCPIGGRRGSNPSIQSAVKQTQKSWRCESADCVKSPKNFAVKVAKSKSVKPFFPPLFLLSIRYGTGQNGALDRRRQADKAERFKTGILIDHRWLFMSLRCCEITALISLRNSISTI